MIDILPARTRLDGKSIHIVRYDPAEHEALWDSFIDRSMNGTAFHRQQFLRYHPEGRFDFHHLLFFSGDKLVAVLPGGLREGGRVFESPLGASYGSFVMEDISAQIALDVVEAFEGYVRRQGIEEVYLTAAPVIYQPVLTQNLDFALLYRGYSYQRHYIS
ncbi:MAG: GNAT family N-acetyltransferase, partial [Candidatus Kapaibacterium sp.]